MSYAYRVCPICGETKNSTKLFEQKFAKVDGITFIEKYDVISCGKCGFIYANHLPEQEAFDRYYTEESKYEAVNEDISEENKERYDATVKLYSSALERDGKKLKTLNMVDVGCATGEFLRYLKQEGYDRLFAIDPSEYCVDYLKSKGIEGYSSTINGLSDEKKFDFVRLNAVLEHIMDLNGTIMQLRKIVEDEGYLYLSVPNVDGFCDTDNAPFQEFSTEHINYFSLETLTSLLKKHGFLLVGHQINTNEKYSELEAVFKKTDMPVNYEFISYAADSESVEKLRVYISNSEKIEEKIISKLNEYAENQKPVIIWGMGVHTLRELAVGSLGKCNIKMFVDSNLHYQGKEYKGIKVCAPNDIDSQDTIIISSYHSQEAIKRYARDVLKLDNEIVCLYNI